MNWNLLFFLIVVVGLPLTFIFVGIWKVMNNWDGPNGYKKKLDTFWAGEKKKKIIVQKSGQKVYGKELDGSITEETVEGVKHVLSNKGHIILIMYLVTILIWYFLPVIGEFWISVFFGLVIGFFTTISKAIDTRRGLKIAGGLFVLSLIFDFIIRAPLFIAATLFLIVGPPSYVFEKVTKKDSFPWWMTHVCLAMVGINLCLALLTLFGFDHSAFMPVLETDESELGWHIYAEASRLFFTGSDFLDAVKWLIALGLILLTSGPIELAQRLKSFKDQKDKDKKEGKGPSPLTTFSFILYESLIGVIFRLFGRDEMGKEIVKKITPEVKIQQ